MEITHFFSYIKYNNNKTKFFKKYVKCIDKFYAGGGTLWTKLV